MSIKSAEDPMQARQRRRRAKSRANRVFGNASRETGRPHSGGQRQPGKRFELVVEKERLRIAGRMLNIRKRRTTAIVEDRAKKLVVLLVKAVQTHLQIVLRHVRRKAHLPSAIG